MTYKYLKLILLLTVSIQAVPKVFNSLGNDLELFQEENCKTYKKITSLPEKIKKKCRTFDAEVNNAFKFGYKLDPYIDSEISEKKLNRYLSLLRDLDKRKDNILTLVYSEAKKARKKDNTKYYSQLIENDKLRLYSSDYEFMEKNENMFIDNSRFVTHLKHLEYLKKLKKEEDARLKRVAQDKNSEQVHQQSMLKKEEDQKVKQGTQRKKSKQVYQQQILKNENTRLSPNLNKCYKYFDDVVYRTRQVNRSVARQDWYSTYIYSKIILEKCPIALKTCKELPRSGKQVDKTIYITLEKICKSTKENFHKVETLYKLKR